MLLRKCNTLYKELRTNESHIVAGGGHLQNISNKMSRATFTSVLVKHTLILLFCKSLTWKAHSSQPKSNWPTLQLLKPPWPGNPYQCTLCGRDLTQSGMLPIFSFCENSLWCGIWGRNDIANIINLCAITFHNQNLLKQRINALHISYLTLNRWDYISRTHSRRLMCWRQWRWFNGRVVWWFDG